MNDVAAMLLQRLGIASIEVTVLAVAVFAIIRVLQIRQPRTRALLWALVIAKPVFTLLLGAIVPIDLPNMSTTATTMTVEHEIEAFTMGPAPSDTNVAVIPVASTASPSLPMLLAILWIAGAAVAAVRVAVGRVRLHRFLSRARRIEDSTIADAYRRTAADLTIKNAPPLRVSSELDSPAIVGTLRPTIVLPAWLIADGVTPHVTWALRHELTHWRLRDPWIAQLVEVCRSLFFFHPVVFFISKSWRNNAEMACDRELVVSDHDAREYAEQLYRMLLRVREHRRTALAGSLFASRTQIGQRVEALLGHGERPNRRTLAALGLLSVLVLCVGADWSRGEREAATSVTVERQDDGDLRHRAYSCLQETSDGFRQALRIEGRVEFADDYSSIDVMDSSSWLDLREEDKHGFRHLRVTLNDAGEIEYGYAVNGETALFDNKARVWMVTNVRTCLEPPEMLNDMTSTTYQRRTARVTATVVN